VAESPCRAVRDESQVYELFLEARFQAAATSARQMLLARWGIDPQLQTHGDPRRNAPVRR
jgi:hypothetical protein